MDYVSEICREIKPISMIATQEKTVLEVKQENFNLIQGEFSPNDALSIVTDLYSKKINFHELKNFSQLIQFGAKDSATNHRILALKEAKKQASEFINSAKIGGRSVRVKASISIEIL